MENYPSNSKTVRVDKKTETKAVTNEKPKVERVVQNEVIQRKKPLGKRFAETFVGGDVKSVSHYVAVDVLIPAARDMVADAITQGVERMIFGEARSTNRRTSSFARTAATHVAYNRFGGNTVRVDRPDPRDQRPTLSRQARSTHSFDELILATRAEAEEVIDRLYSLLSQYGNASVNDLYDMVGISGDYTDEKWGWTNLNGAGVVRTRGGGYLLDLPKPEPLD